MKNLYVLHAVLAIVLALSPAAFADTLAKIKASGNIVIGWREAALPLSYSDDKQQPVGYQIDICNKIIETIKAELKLPTLKVKYQVVNSQNRIPLISNGTVDMECGSSTNNESRQKQVAFSLTTFVSNVRMAVKKSSGISSLTQLNGAVVMTTAGSTSVHLIRNHKKGHRIEFREIQSKDNVEAFTLLETDRASAFIKDDILLAGMIASAKHPADYAIVGEVLNIEPIAIMLRKDDPTFKRLVDASIVALMKSGELDRLYAKWFMSALAPKGLNLNFPMDEKLRNLIKHPSDAPAETYNK